MLLLGCTYQNQKLLLYNINATKGFSLPVYPFYFLRALAKTQKDTGVKHENLMVKRGCAAIVVPCNNRKVLELLLPGFCGRNEIALVCLNVTHRRFTSLQFQKPTLFLKQLTRVAQLGVACFA